MPRARYLSLPTAPLPSLMYQPPKAITLPQLLPDYAQTRRPQTGILRLLVGPAVPPSIDASFSAALNSNPDVLFLIIRYAGLLESLNVTDETAVADLFGTPISDFGIDRPTAFDTSVLHSLNKSYKELTLLPKSSSRYRERA